MSSRIKRENLRPLCRGKSLDIERDPAILDDIKRVMNADGGTSPSESCEHMRQLSDHGSSSSRSWSLKSRNP